MFYMRYKAAILFLFLIPGMLQGQEKKPQNLPAFDYKTLHWGFTVGLNYLDFAVQRKDAPNYVYADVMGFQPAGFQVNVVSDLRLTDYWTLRFLPGINLGSRRFVYYDVSGSVATEDYSMTAISSFLDFPLLLKYRSERVNNYRPYVVGGLSFRYDMSARREFDLDDDDRIRLKPADLYVELGFGVDNYLQFFKYSTELKLAIGLRNMLVTDDPFPGAEQYVESLSAMRSYMVMLNFHFE
jgi:hypothetical protein